MKINQDQGDRAYRAGQGVEKEIIFAEAFVNDKLQSPGNYPQATAIDKKFCILCG
jgi:hypothetical protein